VSTPGKVATVDISRLFMERYPTFWHERVARDGKATLEPCHFAFHEGRVLVGIWLAAPEVVNPQETAWDMYYPPLPHHEASR